MRLMRSISLVVALAIAASPASAMFGRYTGHWAKQRGAATPTLYAADCLGVSPSSTSVNFGTATTSAPAGDSGLFIVTIGTESGAKNAQLSTLTIDGDSSTTTVDTTGGASGAQSLVQAHVAVRNSLTTGADSVTITATFDQTIGHAVACFYFIANANSATEDSSADNRCKCSTAISLTLSNTDSSGFAVGMGANDDGGSTAFTWAVLTGRENINQGGEAFGNADLAATGSSMSVTCAHSTGKDTACVAAAFH